MKRMRILSVFSILCALGMMISGAAAEEDRIMALIREMSLREKVGQLFMIRPDALERRFGPAEIEDTTVTGTTRVSDEMRELYADYPCGGFALFRKNILAPSQLKGFVDNLRGIGRIPTLLGIDEEGGRVARIANHPTSFGVPRFPSMQKIAASGNSEKAYEVGKTIGGYLDAFGLDIDFAPVADVNTNPRNVVIGDRAFGKDPEKAAEMVAQVVKGLHDGGVLSCVKHFPGHGDTAADTHTGYAETLKTWEEISACEMIPFRAGIEAGTDLIMTAHIAAPNVTGGEEPASVSPLLLTEKLRGELGFSGVIITDALAMGAIHEHYSSTDAAVLALQAGADVLLMPYDYFEAFDGVVKAVEEGTLSEERIEESVSRVLKLKETRSLFKE